MQRRPLVATPPVRPLGFGRTVVRCVSRHAPIQGTVVVPVCRRTVGMLKGYFSNCRRTVGVLQRYFRYRTSVARGYCRGTAVVL